MNRRLNEVSLVIRGSNIKNILNPNNPEGCKIVLCRPNKSIKLLWTILKEAVELLIYTQILKNNNKFYSQ